MEGTRSEYIKVYVTEKEEKEIEEAAENVDRSVSNFVRNKTLRNLPKKVKT